MNRRTFVYFIFGGTAVISIPFVSCHQANSLLNTPLTNPAFLSLICEKKEIYEIGLGYRAKVPGEGNTEKLVQLLLMDNTTYKSFSLNSEESSLGLMIEQKIYHDFETNNIISIKGWVLSKTEARQCALFSLA